MSKHNKLLKDIRDEARLTRGYTGRDAFDERVIQAMGAVPRHEFVGMEMRHFAYDNGPLPIGCGQTISQPYIVALMTDLLDPEADDVILEVGMGSGYQAAVLAELVEQVYSVEIIRELWDQANQRLRKLGYDNVESRFGDGYLGLEEFAPYDGILVTAAAPHIPPPLIKQLKPGARLIIPIGNPHMSQELIMVTKDEKGDTVQKDVLPVAFVPLTGNALAGVN
ncbi:MAG: protein-L-isoaspartate(D-aspartate) O-methyltransferase [Gammaproteobacteria bacterium]|nr:protein-L-isoaspartate(D-aspartate) O-methyltransferase [Gammaproteobacteria bacterium]